MSAVSDALEMLEDFDDACVRCGECAMTDCGNYGAYNNITLGDMVESILSDSEDYRHFPFTCALCNRCTVECPMGLMAIDACRPARAVVMDKHPELRENYRHFRTDLRYNLFMLLQEQQGPFEKIIGEKNLNDQANHTAFFPGCSLLSYGPELVEKTFSWLREQDIAAQQINICCGAPFQDTGFFEEFETYRKKVQTWIAQNDITRLVIVCPHCGYELPQLFEGMDITLLRLPDLLNEHGMVVPGEQSITMHDACYDRQEGVFGKAVRNMLEGHKLKPLEEEQEHTICCGGGGMVSAYSPDFCEYRRLKRLGQIDASDADMAVSTCFSCVNSMQRSCEDTPVKHYLELLFDVDVDWQSVYARVDAMYADPKNIELLASDEPMFD